MNQPKPHEQSSWSSNYTSLVHGDAIEVLTNQASEFPAFMRGLTHLEHHSYAPNKWTIKEMLGHIIDTERILTYRALCFARNEKQALPGFEEDDYVANTDFGTSSFEDMIQEFETLRRANLYFFNSLTETELDRMGKASLSTLSVRTLIYVCAGHVIHHSNIISERYL